LFSARRLTTFSLHNNPFNKPINSAVLGSSSISFPPFGRFRTLANLMLSQQNALSITWPTADSGELLFVHGPESIQPGQFLWPVHLIVLRRAAICSRPGVLRHFPYTTQLLQQANQIGCPRFVSHILPASRLHPRGVAEPYRPLPTSTPSTGSRFGELLLVLGPESIKPGQLLSPVYLIALR